MADEPKPEGAEPAGEGAEPPKPAAEKPVAAKPAAPAKPPAAPRLTRLRNRLLPWRRHPGKAILQSSSKSSSAKRSASSPLTWAEFLVCHSDAAIPILEFLKLEADFDYLVDLTAVDYPQTCRALRRRLHFV
jgi:hypothetical protein